MHKTEEVKQVKAQEIHSAKEHGTSKGNNDKALLYAYMVFTESVIVSSKETLLKLKQEQAGASQASKLKSIMDKFTVVQVSQTNGGIIYSYSGTIATNQGANPTYHHFRTRSKPRLYHDPRGITFWIIGSKWYNTQSVVGGWKWNNYKSVAVGKLPVPAMYLTQIDMQNELVDENRDFFRGKISGIQQGNQVIVGNLSAIANEVSQETNQGMNLIQMLEKIGVKISQAFISQRRY
jgi:hypothetical protein